MAGRKHQGLPSSELLSEGLWVQTCKLEELSLDSGLRNKERGKNSRCEHSGTAVGRWVRSLGSCYYRGTGNIHFSPPKKHKQLSQPISNSSPGDQNTRVPQTKSCLIIRPIKFQLTRKTPESTEGTPSFVSKEHFNYSMWIGGKGMKGLSLNRE